MNVLGIETSCDETAASVVKDGKRILSNCVSSSLPFHQKHGGIIPEIASRKQLETIASVVDDALKEARVPKKQIGLISVTHAPGLLGSLLVGISFARAASLSLGIPLVGVNHLNAHIYSAFLNDAAPSFPFLALVVSGGHTSLYLVKQFDAIELIGETLDDACGEAFDKVAKLLGLGYPGGPVIEQWSVRGDPEKIKFKCSGTKRPYDFSFSGIKTAVKYYLDKYDGEKRLSPGKNKALVADICASFQKTVIDTLVEKSLICCHKHGLTSLCVAGGVSANGALRRKFAEACEKNGIKCFFPEKYLSTDNAAMVAGLGYQLYSAKKRNQGCFLY